MKRIRGLSNDQYRERKEAISRALQAAYEGDLVFKPEDQELLDRLDRRR
jgi:hypothetical protein